MHLDLALWLLLISSNYPCLEHNIMVPKMFEPLKFCCIQTLWCKEIIIVNNFLSLHLVFFIRSALHIKIKLLRESSIYNKWKNDMGLTTHQHKRAISRRSIHKAQLSKITVLTNFELQSTLNASENIGIKHGFPCINVCQVPMEMLKITTPEGPGKR